MTISIAELQAMSQEDIDRQSDMLKRMRDLAEQVKTVNNMTTKHSIDWNAVPSLGSGSTLSGPVIYTTDTTSGGSYSHGVIGNGGWTTIDGSSGQMNMKQSGVVEIKGKDADLKINGKSMTAWMERVEQRLNILTPNPELEKEWDDLRRLGERYRKLEKKCQEKAQMWEALKKLPKVKL
jgi:hypothetical protein